VHFARAGRVAERASTRRKKEKRHGRVCLGRGNRSAEQHMVVPVALPISGLLPILIIQFRTLCMQPQGDCMQPYAPRDIVSPPHGFRPYRHSARRGVTRFSPHAFRRQTKFAGHSRSRRRCVSESEGLSRSGSDSITKNSRDPRSHSTSFALGSCRPGPDFMLASVAFLRDAQALPVPGATVLTVATRKRTSPASGDQWLRALQRDERSCPGLRRENLP